MFCDISKAFDRVWHRGLLFKLRQYGINGELLQWLNDYLYNRKQSVVVGSEISSILSLTAGVPQGSALGPLLFLIYVNDIAEHLLSVTRLFADDSSLAVSSNNMQYIETTLNQDLQKINDWSRQWLVNFNPNKTEIMIFPSSVTFRPTLYFNNTKLDFAEHHKHLGLTLSSDLKWHEHIHNITVSATKVLSSMRAVKYKLKRNTINQIYISYMRPILEYASVVWDGCTEYEKRSLELLQFEAARVVTGLTRSVSIHLLTKEIGWVPLSDRRKIQKLITVFKAKQGLIPSYLRNIFPNIVSETTDYPLRNNDNYTTIARRTQVFNNSFIPSSTALWNSLDASIRNAESLNIFKSRLREMFKAPIVPKHFLYGERSLSVLHARLRNKCSNLNNDLFNNYIRVNPHCDFDSQIEDSEHFFFQCNKFTVQRITLFNETRAFHPLSVNLLLHGRETLNVNENIIIFAAVQKYIKQSKRF